MTDLEKQELLEEAKRRFPVGTKFKGVAGADFNKIITVGDHPILSNIHGIYCGNSYLVLFDNLHKWATIICKPEIKHNLILAL